MASPQHALYLPRLVLDWLRDKPTEHTGRAEGTLIFADVSGFTALSDRLAIEMGKGGSEAVTAVMNDAFGELVEIVFLEHGDLLRFGGDALVAWFTGEEHSGRACRAAVDMREAITEIDAGDIDLGISIGVASGEITIDLIGTSHREIVLSGEGVDLVIAAEGAADRGQIFVSANLESEIGHVATMDETGFLSLDDDPDTAELLDEPDDLSFAPDSTFSDFISPDFRDLLTLSLQEGEHRPASIGFVKFSGLGALDDASRQAAMERLFEKVTTACSAYDVAYVSNDIDKDGGKFILAAGVPRRTSGEEGMALALFDIVPDHPDLHVSGGCARGYVFSGDLGAPSRRVFTVMGDTVNLAARLAAAAADGQVLISEAALERSRGNFETNRLEGMTLKGKSKKIAPFEILAAHDDDAAQGAISLFGRDEELALMTRAIKSGLNSGAVIALVADDGMGRGQLATVAVGAMDESVVRIKTEVVSGEAHTVTKTLMAGLLGITATDDLAAELQSVVNKHAPDLAEWIPLIGRTWGLSIPDTDTSASIAPEFVASKMAQLNSELLGAALAGQPTIIQIQDLDAADQPSQKFVEALAGAVPGNPWTLITTSLQPITWLPPTTTTLHLQPFTDEQAHGFIRWVLQDGVLPSSTISTIIERGQGNPYLLGELTKVTIDGGTVPESIEAVALSKMDKLDQRDKQLLMYAAVLGVEARIDLLASLLPEISSAIEDSGSWDRLAEFVDTSTIGKIRFRDAVLRDVAYGMLPQRRRQEIHALVGTAIEKRARRRPERFVDDLSYHFHLAQDWERSWTFSTMAAEKAQRSYAMAAAARFWKRAIEAGETKGGLPSELAEAQEHLGDAYEQAGSFPEAAASYSDALELAEDDPTRIRLTQKQGLVDVRLGAPEAGRERFDAVLASAHASVEDTLRAKLGIAGVQIRTGRPHEAAKWCHEVIDAASFEDYPAERARAFYILSLASAKEGQSDAADQAKEALYIYEQLGDKAGAANALNNLGFHFFYTGNWAACEEYHLRNRQARVEMGDVLGGALAGYNLGELYMEQGRYDEASELLARTLADFRGAKHLVGEAATRLTIGRLAARQGDIHKATHELDRATSIATDAKADDQIKEAALGHLELALLTGQQAEARSRINDMDASELHYDGGLGARLEMLRCVSLAAAGEDAQARAALSKADELAEVVGSLHLICANREIGAKLFGEDTQRVDALSEQLGLVARPAFRIS